MQADRGFAFVKLDTHENAANAIINLTGTPVHGRQLKCSWGKDRMDGPAAAGGAPPQVPQQQYMVSSLMALSVPFLSLSSRLLPFSLGAR